MTHRLTAGNRSNFDKNSDMRRLKGKVKGWEFATKVMSFPPLRTNQFNPDGTELFRSRIQISVCLPSMLFILLIIIVLLIPLFFSLPVESVIVVDKLNYGFQMASNDTDDLMR